MTEQDLINLVLEQNKTTNNTLEVLSESIEKSNETQRKMNRNIMIISVVAIILLVTLSLFFTYQYFNYDDSYYVNQTQENQEQTIKKGGGK